jgi:uncharacterized protein (DUF983 family)
MANELIDDRRPRDVGQAMLRGSLCRCPRCGQGRLFGSFLKVAPACTACGQPFEGHRADDAPPYITMFIVGHVVVGLNLAVERGAEWPMWLHFSVWIPLALVLSLVLLQPIKGAMVGLQWANRMHGFDPDGDIHEVPFRGTDAAKPKAPER